jgi:class 3 adenylate cyclase/DNA-binding CsgD family transcriptional regulator/tetratricopeptide (TPR) repeat protein
MTGKRDLPSGTVTFLFSDMEGSTRLLKQLGRDSYGELLAAHNALLRDAFTSNGGIEIDRQGDAFFFVFRSAGTAVVAAATAQRAMLAHEWPEAEPVRVRIGLHTGEASVNGEGYVGFAVHQAARIGDLGHGGQILVSRTTAALVEHDLAADIRLRSLGEARVPGLDKPEPIFQLVCDGLPDRFPPLGARRRSSAPPQPEGPTLLEREGELAALHAYIDSAASGAGRLIAIEGRAGIGKTRLLAEARTIATRAGLTVLNARGGEMEQEFAYGIVRQLFEPMLASATSDEHGELLGGAAALAGALFEDVTMGVDDDETDVSFAMLHGLYWLAANVALRKPLMIAIDDLHWADGSSLRWLAHLERRLDGLPLLVVVATRPPDQSPAEAHVTEILAEPTAAIVRPTSLSEESVGRMAREIFGREADASFVAACWSATNGTPLFVSALLDTIKREGLEPTAENAARVQEIGPAPVTRAVSLRLSRLPSEATVLIRAVAVLGGRAELRHAAELAGLDRELANHAATTLARADLLNYEMPLEFTHPVVRTAVYEDMSAPERIAAHRRAAQILSDAGAEPEQVAVHLEQSIPNGDPFVVETLQVAAQRALQRGSSDVAVSLLKRALEEPPPPPQYGEIVRALGMAQRLLDNPEAIRLLSQAFDLIEEPKRRTRIGIELGRSLLRANEHEKAMDAFRAARDVLGDADADLAESVWSELINAGWWYPEHVALAEAELALVDERTLHGGVGSDLLRATLGYWETRRGQNRERALELARAAIAPQRIDLLGTRGLHLATYTLTMCGYPDEALAVYDRVLRAANARGDNVLASTSALFRAYTQLRRGNLAAVESDIFRFSELVSYQTTRLYSHAVEAELAMELGDLDRAASTIAANALPEKISPNGHLTFFQLARAKLWLEQRRHDDAIREFRSLGENCEALGIGDSAFYDWRPYLALALHAAGRSKEAVPVALESVDRARSWGAPQSIGVALRTLGLVEGGSSGEKLLHEAVAVLADSQWRLEHAKALVDLGAALRRGNKRTDSREFLRQGLELAHKLGAAALEERAQTELAATGARPRRLMLSGLESLTPSERRVAEMAAENMTNKDIAQALFVTPKTVEVHLSSVYRKLEISSRAQLPDALNAAT